MYLYIVTYVGAGNNLGNLLFAGHTGRPSIFYNPESAVLFYDQLTSSYGELFAILEATIDPNYISHRFVHDYEIDTFRSAIPADYSLTDILGLPAGNDGAEFAIDITGLADFRERNVQAISMDATYTQDFIYPESSVTAAPDNSACGGSCERELTGYSVRG